MNFLFLIHASEARFAKLTEAERGAHFGAYGAYTKELMATGKASPGAALLPSTAATTVRVREGRTLLTDGPFAETKEQLAGFYGFTTDSVEEALHWASRIPDAAHGTIEVRTLPDRTPPGALPPIAARPADAKQEYLLLIVEDDEAWTSLAEADQRAMFARYFGVTKGLREAGLYLGGSGLTPAKTGKNVRVRDGKMLVSDGPFAETKEQLGGYYRMVARDLDQAVSYAKQLPAAEKGAVVVWPVMDLGQLA